MDDRTDRATLIALLLSTAHEADRRADQCGGESAKVMRRNALRHRRRAAVLEDQLDVEQIRRAG